jgi:hypothetical protein
MSFVTHLEREPTMVVLMILFGWHAVGYFPPSPSFLPYPYSPGASVDPGFEHPLGAHVRSTVLRVDLHPSHAIARPGPTISGRDCSVLEPKRRPV